MSRYANKVEKIESGNWVMKSAVLLGGWWPSDSLEHWEQLWD